MRYFALLLFFLASSVTVQAKTIHFILSSESRVVGQAVHDIQSQLIQADTSIIHKTTLINQFSDLDIASEDLLVAIGNKAAKELTDLGLPNHTIIGFTDTQTNAYISTHRQHNAMSVISLNQPTQRLVAFSDPIAGTGYKKSLLVAVSEQNEALLSELNAIAPLTYGQLKVVIIPKGTLAAKVLEPDLFDAAVLIAIQDNEIWAGKNAKWLLQQAFNYKVPVVGYSKSFLKAGALASVYSSLDDVASGTAKSINAWLNDTAPNSFTILYPEATIEINPSVARVYRPAAERLTSQEKVE
jgi:ABC-type uncharacterized transport system substrate-binding protein